MAQSPRELAPARALLTPTWIAALALLVANDHWLKGSGLLPDLVTGKLSDFAGLIVAPTLLASLLGVRGHRGLLACHVAVGAVFAAIQVSLPFAELWAGLMAMIGHPWVITSDLSDLLALPMLLASWRLLVPEMDADAPAFAPLQRTAVACLSLFGLWSTVATSQETWIDDDGVWYQDVEGQLYINNANDFDIALFIRPLRWEDMDIDCGQIAGDPGRLLSEDAFGEAEHWLLPPRTNVAFTLSSSNSCGAAWIAGEGITPTIVFSDNVSSLAWSWFPGQSFSTDELGSAGMAIEFGESGSKWIGGEMLRHRPKTDAPEQPDSCEAPVGESRFAWGFDVPNRPARLLSVNIGVDGCFALDLQNLTVAGGEIQTVGDPYTYFLCVPEVAMPFVADDVLSFIDPLLGDGAAQLIVTLLDGATLEPAVDESGEMLRQARYLRGVSGPNWIGQEINRGLLTIDAVSCPWLVEGDGCAQVERPVELALSGASEYLEAGVPVSFADADQALVHTVVLGYARQLAVVDRSCAMGSLNLSYDIDITVIAEPLM